MKLIFTFISYCFFFSNIVLGQNTTDAINDLIQQSEHIDTTKTGSWIQEAISVNEAILELDCQQPNLSDSLNVLVFSRLSFAYQELGYTQQCFYYAQAALSAAKNHYGSQALPIVSYLGQMLRIMEDHLREPEASIHLRQEIEKIRKKAAPIELSDRLKSEFYDNLIRLGNTYVILENEISFLTTYEQLDVLNKDSSYCNDETRFLYVLFKSHGYLSFNKAEEAYDIIYPAYQKQVERFKINQSSIAKILIIQTVLTEIHLALQQPKAALALYKKNLAILQQQKAKDRILYKIYNAAMGAKALNELKQYDEAEKILKSVLLKYKNNVKNEKDLSYSYLTDCYQILAENQYKAYQNTQNINQLYRAHAYNQEALHYLQSEWLTLKSQNNIRHIFNSQYDVFETSMLALQELYQLTDSTHYFEKAIRLVELTKNINLRRSLNEEKVAKEHNISRHLLLKKAAIKKQLFDLKYKHYLAKNSADKQLLEDSIYDITSDLLALQTTIHNQYPTYRDTSYSGQNFDWKTLKTYLKQEDQSLLYYVSGKDHLFQLGMNADNEVFIQTELGRDSLKRLVNQLREGIYQSPGQGISQQAEKWPAISHQLYELLIEPMASIAQERLLLIPDEALEKLPFSMLLSTPPQENQTYKEWSYLVKNHSFSSAYAIDLLLNPTPRSSSYSKDQILAFAPDFSSTLLRGDSLRYAGQLTDNKAEVAYIADRFSSKAFYGKDAQLNTFRTMASDYAVLHLATHGAVDVEHGGFSYLHFSDTEGSDSKLKVGDLYTMDIPAELVVLSACETGLGEWQRGEGVIGLERAFFYAGARSVLSTEWKVSDHASAKLMGYFYDELAKDLPKDIALQKAQLAFINEQDTWLAHPFFWAAYVQKGDTNPINVPLKSAFWPWWLLGGLIVGSVLYFYVLKK